MCWQRLKLSQSEARRLSGSAMRMQSPSLSVICLLKSVI